MPLRRAHSCGVVLLAGPKLRVLQCGNTVVWRIVGTFLRKCVDGEILSSRPGLMPAVHQVSVLIMSNYLTGLQIHTVIGSMVYL